MIVHEHPHVVPLKHNGSFRIVAFGDVHWGSRQCAEERFERMVLKENADDPDCYFIGMGDLLDAIVASDQKRFRQSVHTDRYASREDILDASIEEFAGLWERYKIPKHRLIGMLSGNHHDAIAKRHGTDLTERLCYRLKTKNLGYSAFVKVQARVGNHTQPVVLFAHHGFGGSSKTDGASITKYVRHAFRFPGADAYLFGHDHQAWSKRIPVVRPHWTSGTVYDTTFLVAATGSFLRTVSDGAIPGYSEVAGYNPALLGCITLRVKTGVAKYGDHGTKHKLQRMTLEVTASE